MKEPIAYEELRQELGLRREQSADRAGCIRVKWAELDKVLKALDEAQQAQQLKEKLAEREAALQKAEAVLRYLGQAGICNHVEDTVADYFASRDKEK